jgi:hypothetical protein
VVDSDDAGRRRVHVHVMTRERLASSFDPVFYTAACLQCIHVCFPVCVIDVCFPVCVHVNVATVVCIIGLSGVGISFAVFPAEDNSSKVVIMNMTPGGPAAMSNKIGAQHQVLSPLCVSITITHPHFICPHSCSCDYDIQKISSARCQ